MANKIETAAMAFVLALTATPPSTPIQTVEDWNGDQATLNQMTVFDCEKGPRSVRLKVPLKDKEVDIFYGRAAGEVVGAGVEYGEMDKKDRSYPLGSMSNPSFPNVEHLDIFFVDNEVETLGVTTPFVDYDFTKRDGKLYIDINCRAPEPARAYIPQEFPFE